MKPAVLRLAPLFGLGQSELMAADDDDCNVMAGVAGRGYTREVAEKAAEKADWYKLHTLRSNTVLCIGGAVDMSTWLALVPPEHLEAMAELTLRVFDRHMGRPATQTRMEVMVHELYSEVASYLKEREHHKRVRQCPACGDVLGDEAHAAKPFDVALGTQITAPRFWVCHKSADALEAMLRMFREAGPGDMMNIP